MNNAPTNRNSHVYQQAVSVIGILAWLGAAVRIYASYGWRDQLTFLSLAPVIVIGGMFVQTFRLPLGSRFTTERVTFTLTDGFVILIACWFGVAPAVFLAGIEGFTSSRRTARRLSSNFFSSAMMSLGAAASAFALGAVLRYGYGETMGNGFNHTLLAVAVAMLAGGIVQISINIALFSTLLTLRKNDHAWAVLKGFIWAVPMFLPNSAAAFLMYYALQHDLKLIVVIGGPVFLAIYFGQRQYRQGVQNRIGVMEKAHRETIEALAVAINAKDEVTHEHVLRVQIYASGVARLLGCSKAEIDALKAGALLHDIGKIAVPDYILNKPGKLTAAEFEKMKIHTLAGAQILSRVEFPYPIVPVVRHHHERWDGKGYPDGLAGEDIPLTARILSVVDCFDAVREDRQYRKGMTREEAIDLIMRGSGSQYDPRIVGTFIAHLPEFEAEVLAHRDTPAPTYGIEPTEQLSEAARLVPPAAGLAEDENKQPDPVNDEVRGLCDLAQAVMSAHEQDEVISAFVQKLSSIVPFCLCAVTMADSQTGENAVAYASGQHSIFLTGRKIAPGEGVTGWVLANRKPFCNADPKLDLPTSLTEQFDSYKTLAAFPIIKGATMYGAVTVYSTALSEYSQAQQRLMGEAVALMATALSVNSETGVRSAGRNLGLGDAALEYELTH